MNTSLDDAAREACLAGLRRSDLKSDPIQQFDEWFRHAAASGIREPNAMTLATADKTGMPSARVVLLKECDTRGFVFFTNYESPKGRELAENPRAALVFFWSDLERQVRISGNVSKISREESESYFRTRPFGSRVGAWASQQSAVLPNREELDRRVQRLLGEYEGKDVPLPSYWGGYRVEPTAIEFWQGRPSRLHDRFLYTRQPSGEWKMDRLSP